MKKRILATICAMTMVFGVSTTVLAADSKQQKPVQKETKAPATGEANTTAAAVVAAVALGGVVVISKKKIAE